MAPKKKGGKKAQDNWEDDVVETPEPVAQPAATDGNDDDEEMGGGLLAALKKNRAKKVKKGKAVEEIVEAEDPSEENGEEKPQEVNLADKAPEEANMEDDDLFGQPAKKGKGGKATQKAKDDDDEELNEGGHVKSKKEKEREKKEREKQRKKEQAAKKKTTAPAGTEPAKPKDEPKAVVVAAPVAAAEPSKPEPAGGKKKKLNPALLALQKQQEELRRRKELEAKLVEEENARIAELERQEAEETKAKAEARAAKKQREKEKIEQQKREGTYKTKAQKEEEARIQLRLKQMLESGTVKVDGLAETVEQKKKPSYDKKKKASKKAEEDKKAAEAEEARKKLEELKLAEEQAAKAKAEQEAKAKAEEEAKKAKEADDVKDSWDASSDDEDGVKDSWDAASDAGKDPKTKAVPAGGKESTEDEESEEESDSESEEEMTATQKQLAARKAEAAERRRKRDEEAMAAASKDNLRSPICCILGHVDTGKTKLLDKIRQTNVQEGEAGGITQQIGATYFPVDALEKKTKVVNQDGSFVFKVPGLLVIDTPGHESFSNLRSRGSSLCNIAILVVDIMHGLEPQTLESMRLLRDRKTPFIVALNKIDRLYGWKKIDNNGFEDSLAFQSKSTQNEFKDRLQQTKLAFAEQGFNAELFHENKNTSKFVSLVPTSAHTGEGIPDLLKLLVGLTQERMTKNLMYLSKVEATVLEVKVIEGLGTTIDVILSNGVIKEGDTIVLCGLNGAISTNIRALLTPAEMKELRVKSQYVHNKEVKAAIGVKIAADGLEHAIAGSRLLVLGPDDDEEDLEEDVMTDLENLLSRVTKTGRGVSVQASTLGSLEALLEFLRVSKIPVGNVSIGPVFKRDVMQTAIMLEKAKEYAVMLCFDVRVDKDAAAYAESVGVKIFTADIIYHLFDAFTAHMAKILEDKKEASKLNAVFPCVLRPVAIFNKTEPIVIGVDVIEGNLKLLTPIAAVKAGPDGQKQIIKLGRVWVLSIFLSTELTISSQSIERDHKQLPNCPKGAPSVAIKIEGPNQPLYGRQLEEKDLLYSLISRTSIDTLKEFYRADCTNDDWHLLRKLKSTFDVS
jgi:translation initiation factor 5B